MEQKEYYELTMPGDTSSLLDMMREATELGRLHARRLHWLTDPVNQRKSTYKAIEADTKRIAGVLEELRAKLEERVTLVK